MSAGPLDLARRALRDAGAADAGSPVVAASRARVLERAGAARRRRHRAVRLLLPVAAVLVLSSAWASTRGRRPAWLETRRSEEGARVEARVAPPSSAMPQVVAPPPPAAPSSPSEDVAPPIPVVPVEALARAPSHSPPRASSPPPAAPAAATTPPAEDDPADARDMELYAAAHRAHFFDRDWGSALRAWDAYLAAAPRGRFALEARYNRAIALVRLGRTTEARRALEPFAEGRYGGYRAGEARDILAALDARGGP